MRREGDKELIEGGCEDTLREGRGAVIVAVVDLLQKEQTLATQAKTVQSDIKMVLHACTELVMSHKGVTEGSCGILQNLAEKLYE